MIITEKNNYIWLDCETSGLDPVRNDVVQLAAIAQINGVLHKKVFSEYCQPFDYSTVDQQALDVSHLTVSQLKTFQTPQLLVKNFVEFLESFNVKFTIAGYNSAFDKSFISSLFLKCNREKDFVRLFNSDLRDTFKRAKIAKEKLGTQNLKLATLAAHFNIEINAHEALSDITATIEVDKKIAELLGDTFVHQDIVDHIVDESLALKEPALLHMHSKYSYTDAIDSLPKIANWCISNKIPAFSIVDHGYASSLFEMSKTADLIKAVNKEYGTKHDSKAITTIPGIGLRVDRGGNKFFLNVWATSNEGYQSIIKLSSLGWRNKEEISKIDFPVLPIEELYANSRGVVVGVPGINGPITDLMASNRLAEAENLILDLKNNLDIRLELTSLDVFKKFDSDLGFVTYSVEGGNMQKAINKFYWQMANKYAISWVPTTDSHFVDPEDKVIQDCISRSSFKDERYFSESRHVLKSNEIFTILKAHLGDSFSVEEYLSGVERTYEIAREAATISIKHDYHLPHIEIPKSIQNKSTDYNMQTYLHTMQKVKEHGRWNDSPEYIARFKREIDVIMKNQTANFLPYFLVYEDVCSFARSSGLLQNIARGSAGGCLLSYYLKIIHIDPIASDLPFERFLSHARIRAGSFPDIDLDIADKARPLVMSYLKEKYGVGFAQIATYQTMKTKNAIKDAMHSLYGRNRNDLEVKTICDSIPDSPQGVDESDFLYGYVDQEGEEHTGQVHANPMLANFFEQRPEVEKMVQKLLGAIRSYGRHPSAFVISTLDLASNRVPIVMISDDAQGIPVTQFDAGMVEKIGLIKADILGLKTLSMASECVKLIKENHNIDLLEEEKGVPLIYRLPDRDSGVFSDFYKKDTDSSFQFNSSLIKGFAQDFAPVCREDLAAMTALLRPGSLDAPFGPKKVVLVEYEDGTLEHFEPEEYELWLKKFQNQH